MLINGIKSKGRKNLHLLSGLVSACCFVKKAGPMSDCDLYDVKLFFRYVWSGLIVVLGIYLNVYSKNQQKVDDMLRQCAKKLTKRDRKISTAEQIV